MERFWSRRRTQQVEETENRLEKRAKQKENKKLKVVKLKEEKARIFKLVELAYSSDPRIIIINKKEEEKEINKQERLVTRKKFRIEKEENEKKIFAENEEK